jgi:V/A-type H+-transporting ATPase subunit E
MADELQALLDRLSEQELKKVDAQRQDIIAEAKKEADDIIAQAKNQAENIVADAEKASALFSSKGEEALRQAARDVLLALRGEFEQRVTKVVEELLQSSFADSTQLAAIIAQVITAYLADSGDASDLQILLPQAQLDTLKTAVHSALAADLRQHCELAPSSTLSGGFKLLFKDEGLMYDFSDQALAEAVAAYVNPRLAALITDKSS